MTLRLIIIQIAVTAAILQGAILNAYEPSYNEILIQRQRLENFCKMADNQRKYDICERYQKIKGRLPDRIDEIIIFRKIYETKGK